MKSTRQNNLIIWRTFYDIKTLIFYAKAKQPEKIFSPGYQLMTASDQINHCFMSCHTQIHTLEGLGSFSIN